MVTDDSGAEAQAFTVVRSSHELVSAADFVDAQERVAPLHLFPDSTMQQERVTRSAIVRAVSFGRVRRARVT